MVKSKSFRRKRGGSQKKKGGNKGKSKLTPKIQINIDGGGFFDELKNAFGLDPTTENIVKNVVDPEKSKLFSQNLQKAMEAGIEEKKVRDELKSKMDEKKMMKDLEEKKLETQLKSQKTEQKFMKEMMDKMNKNDNKELTKTINENLPLILNEVQQLRDLVATIDNNISSNRASQIQEKIEEKKEEEEIVNLRQKLMDRDKMILNIFNSKKNELLKSL